MAAWSVQRRLLLSTFLTMLLLFGLLFGLLFLSSRDAYIEQNQLLVSLFAENEAKNYLTRDEFTANGSAERYAKFSSELHVTETVLHVTIFDQEGHIRYCDDPAMEGGSYADAAPLRRALAGEVVGVLPPIIHQERVAGYERTMETFLPIYKEGELVGAVSVHQALVQLESIFERLILLLGGAFLITFLAFFLLVHFLFRRATGLLQEEQAALQRRNVELGERDRLKDDMISNVNHELRQPLTAIRAYAEFLKEGDLGELNREEQEAVDTIYESTLTLEHTINNMLDLSKLEAGSELELAHCHVEEIVEPVVKEAMPLIREARLEHHLRIEPGLPALSCDKEKTQAALRNLLSNAIKYTEEGGVTIRVAKREGMVEFSVEDSGIGIPKSAIPKLFDKYYQVGQSTTKQKGSGLGLNIVKHIVEAQGGEVRVESRPGKGSTFSFTVPAA